ncbi:MAG: hypothetical protein ACJA1Z_002050 [Patiriisocius sp.]|jgi:hypothetical protein
MFEFSSNENKSINAAANNTPNVIPFRLVSIQFNVLIPVFLEAGTFSENENTSSKPIPLKLVTPSMMALEYNAGYREENQKMKHNKMM